MMDRMTQSVRQLWRCDAGATAIEYALIAGMIAIAIVSAVGAVGSGTANNFNAVENGWPEN